MKRTLCVLWRRGIVCWSGRTQAAVPFCAGEERCDGGVVLIEEVAEINGGLNGVNWTRQVLRLVGLLITKAIQTPVASCGQGTEGLEDRLFCRQSISSVDRA